MKKIFTTVMLSAMLGLSAIAQIPTNGLVAYYPFNGNANDESGNGNNGTVHGATLTADRFGKSSSAYRFNSVNKNYIELNSTVGKFGTSDFTISLWYNISNTNALRYLICKRNTESYANFWEFHANEFALCQSSSSNSSTPTYVSSAIIPLNQWNHQLVIKTTDSVKIFLNGVLVSSKKLTIAYDITNNNPAEIGAQVAPISGVVGCYNGLIDDIRLYNRALNQSEITALFNEGINKCSITVTDTLVINANITGFNPITYQNNIKIYPNPTNDDITIDCGSNYNTLNGYKIKITNSLSQSVYEADINKQTEILNLKSWTGNGIYFLQLIDGNSNVIENKKIVLQ